MSVKVNKKKKKHCFVNKELKQDKGRVHEAKFKIKAGSV